MSDVKNKKAIEAIKKIVREEGSQYAAAKRLDISAVYLSDILAGNRSVSDQVARKLGLRRVVSFEPLQEKE